MAKMDNVTFRLLKWVIKKIDDVCSKTGVANRSVFIRMAVMEKLMPYLTEDQKRAMKVLKGSDGNEEAE